MSQALTISAVSGWEKRFVEICLQHISVALEAPAPDESCGVIFFSRKKETISDWVEARQTSPWIFFELICTRNEENSFRQLIEWVAGNSFRVEIDWILLEK